MKTIMTNLLDKLKTRVHLNLDTMRANVLEVRLILKQPITNIRSQKLSNRFALNKQILEENKKMLQIQHLIVEFLNLYNGFPDYSNEMENLKRTEDEIDQHDNNSNNLNESFYYDKSENKLEDLSLNNEEQEELTSPDNQDNSILNLTIRGKLKFNKSHPEFHNNLFFDKLLKYFIHNEEYEICAQLSKIKRN
jgi:hypothetical protein